MDMKSRHMLIEICESLHGLALRDRPMSRNSTSRDISRVWGYKIFSAMLLATGINVSFGCVGGSVALA
eukprot:scaffold21344_cov126-Skeletonema_marinoi.AAC.1